MGRKVISSPVIASLSGVEMSSSNEDIVVELVKPWQWFKYNTFSSTLWDEYADLLKKPAAKGCGWSLIRGITRFETSTKRIILTNSLHLVIVPDETRKRFMKDYPGASPSSFYQKLRERCGQPNPPEFLKEITLSPPLRYAQTHANGVLLIFDGPNPDLFPRFPCSVKNALTPNDQFYQKPAPMPHLRLFCGDFSTKPAAITHRYIYNVHYEDLDCELLDGKVVQQWRFGCTKAGYRNRLRFPTQGLVVSQFMEYQHTVLPINEMRAVLVNSIKENCNLAEQDGTLDDSELATCFDRLRTF